MQEHPLLQEHPYDKILANLKEIDIIVPKNVDNRLYLSILHNRLADCDDDNMIEILRNRLYDFSKVLKVIQHYCFHSNITGLTKLLGKLLTRLWWIHHTSSPIMKSMTYYDPESDSDSE
jgi:hypothetical protein